MNIHINYFVLIICFIFWLIHFLAICDGIEKRFKLNLFISSILAGVIALIPMVSTLAAIWGAIMGWRWKWWLAILVFVVIDIIIISMIIGRVSVITIY